MSSHELLEVRLLGGLHVVRPDGRAVAEKQWRTAKSADLMRLLALNVDRPVPVSSILEKFWPDVEEARAKASLRTALVHVRKAVGSGRVVRSGLGLCLEGAWVDVAVLRALLSEARTCARTGQHAALVGIARECESLYTADFEAGDDHAPWAVGARRALRDGRKTLLTDAADSAVQLRWFRDAVDFAEAAVSIDPGLERAYRALMRGYAGLGETDGALRAFDRCRQVLGDTLGADPSPLTASVHLEILSATPSVVFEEPDVRVQALTSRLRLPSSPAPHDGHRPPVAPDDGGPDTDAERRLLSRADLLELAETVLAGSVSSELVTQLHQATGGEPHAIMRLLRQWSVRGSVVWTPDGLEVVTEDAGWNAEHGVVRAVRELQRRMSQPQIELMQAVALLRRPVRADELTPLAAEVNVPPEARARAVEGWLERLADAGALRATAEGFEIRTPRLRDATTAWMRPSTRLRLNRRLAENGLLDDPGRT